MGSGFALDSVRLSQYNRFIKKLRRARYSEMKNTVSNIKAKYHKFNDRNILSDKELIKYKKKIKSTIYKKRQIVFLKTFTITILVCIIIVFISKYLYTLFLNSF